MADSSDTSSDEIARRYRYADTEALGGKWIEARKLAEKYKDTPHQARYEMAAELARLKYDFAYAMKRDEKHSEMQVTYLAILEGISHRLSILEGAYAHLMIVAHSGKRGVDNG